MYRTNPQKRPFIQPKQGL